MARISIKTTVCAAAAAMFFLQSGITSQAAGISSVLPNSGVNITLAKGTTLENMKEGTGNTTARINSILEQVELEEARAKAGIKEEPSEDELLKSLVIAQVNDYVNIRSIPSEDGEILGKLYDDSVGTFQGEENGWYLISSGSVTGYVKAQYCVTGDAAIDLAKQVCTRIATVNTETLKVRKEPGLDSPVLTLVPDQDELVVSDEVDGWVKVDTEDGLGWVSTDYVILSREFVEAESREEEAARLAKEAEERRKAREAAAAKAAKSKKSSSKKNTQTNAVVDTSSGSEMGQAVAEYALQFVGNPYVYGGTSLTNGADCSGFILSVYANFGVSLPHSSAADRKQGAAVDGLSNAQPGDLICYSGHVALYIGGGQIVHASNSKTGIIVSDASYKKILAIRRIF